MAGSSRPWDANEIGVGGMGMLISLLVLWLFRDDSKANKPSSFCSISATRLKRGNALVYHQEKEAFTYVLDVLTRLGRGFASKKTQFLPSLRHLKEYKPWSRPLTDCTYFWHRPESSTLGQQRPLEARQASQDRRRCGVLFSLETS